MDDRVEEARCTLRVALQVAHEAHADGLLSDAELHDTVDELRGTYNQSLVSIGVDPRSVREVTLESEDDDGDEDEPRRPGQSRGPGSVASYTTLGSGFTAQTTGTVLSRLAQRLERQRQERLEAGSTLSGATTVYESVRPDSRLSFASSAVGPPEAGGGPSRGAHLAHQAATMAASARDGGAHAQLPPVAEEPTPGGASGRVPTRSSSGTTPWQPTTSVRNAASNSSAGGGRVTPTPSAAPRPKGHMSTAEAMAAHAASLHAAAAQMQGSSVVDTGSRAITPASSRKGSLMALPLPTAPRERSTAASTSRAPASAIDEDGQDDLFDDEDDEHDGDSLSQDGTDSDDEPRSRWRSLTAGGKRAAAAAKKKKPGSTAGRSSNGGVQSSIVDLETGPLPVQVSRAAQPPAWQPPNQVKRGPIKPPEVRWFGIKLPQGLVARRMGFQAPPGSTNPAASRTQGASASSADVEDEGVPLPGEWTPTRLAATLGALCRFCACVVIAAGIASAYLGRGSKRHIAMIAISLGVALLAMWIQADAAGARRTGGVLIGSVIMLAVGTSLSSFCASQAEAYTLQCAALGASSVLRCVDVPGVRVSTHVYAWALGGCAVTLVATGVLLALRLEVTDAVLRHALKRGSLMSLAHATVLTNSAAGKITASGV